MKIKKIPLLIFGSAIAIGVPTASANACVLSGPRYQLKSDRVEWSLNITPGQNCIRGLRFGNVVFEDTKLIVPPERGQFRLHSLGFSYKVGSGFEGEDSFTISVSGMIDKVRGNSTIHIVVHSAGVAKASDGARTEIAAPLAVTSSTCPFATTAAAHGFDDGCADAPTGTPQYPNLLSKYGGNRPGWDVAGVDYRVGINTGVTLKPASSLASNFNFTVSGSTVRCLSASSVALDSLDFTGYVFYNGEGDGCANVTITNSKFACPSSWSAGAPFAMIHDQFGANFTIKYNEFHGDNCGTWPNDTSDPVSVGNLTFQYNLMRGMPERHVSTGNSTIDYRYNLIDQPLTQSGAHENFLQWGPGMIGPATVAFNTSYLTSVGGAEGFQFYTNGTGSIASVSLTNNTMIALPSNGQRTMSFIMHGNCHSGSDCLTTTNLITGSAVANYNYFDISGAYGAFYGGSFSIPGASWSSTGNVNMNTGATITPSGRR